MSNESKCPGHNRAECKSCGWPAPSASYTAVDMTTAAAQGFRDGVASVVVALPSPPKMPEVPEDAWDDSYMDEYHSAKNMREACKAAIIAAGGSVKE